MPQLTGLFMVALTGLSFHRMQLLSALLCLEAMMLIVYVSLALWPIQLMPNHLMTPLALLTMSACEAAVGLSLMIASSRLFSSSNLKNLNLLQW